MIKRKGTIVSIGNASGPVPPFAPLKLVQKNIKLARPAYASLSSLNFMPDILTMRQCIQLPRGP
jgi:hypothetical protein